MNRYLIFTLYVISLQGCGHRIPVKSTSFRSVNFVLDSLPPPGSGQIGAGILKNLTLVIHPLSGKITYVYIRGKWSQCFLQSDLFDEYGPNFRIVTYGKHFFLFKLSYEPNLKIDVYGIFPIDCRLDYIRTINYKSAITPHDVSPIFISDNFNTIVGQTGYITTTTPTVSISKNLHWDFDLNELQNDSIYRELILDHNSKSLKNYKIENLTFAKGSKLVFIKSGDIVIVDLKSGSEQLISYFDNLILDISQDGIFVLEITESPYKTQFYGFD